MVGPSSTSTTYGGSSLDSQNIKNKSQHLMSEDVIEPAHEYLQRAREMGARAMDRGTTIVRENPGYTVLAAASVGFLLGAFLFKRRS